MNIAETFASRSKTEPVSAKDLYAAGASWNRDIQAYVFPDHSAGFFGDSPRFDKVADEEKHHTNYYFFEVLPGTHNPEAIFQQVDELSTL